MTLNYCVLHISNHQNIKNVVACNDSKLSEQHVNTMHKPVSKKVKPVPGVFPEDARVTHKIPVDPLLSLPVLPDCPPEFTPGVCIGFEELKIFKVNEDNFLWPEEVKLVHHIIKTNELVFAFNESQRGTFSEDYFSDYIMPVVEHEPWVQRWKS